MEEVNLKNTHISFTPSFLGNGWETSLLPKIERGYQKEYEYRITFTWIKSMLLKIPQLVRPKGQPTWQATLIRMFL